MDYEQEIEFLQDRIEELERDLQLAVDDEDDDEVDSIEGEIQEAEDEIDRLESRIESRTRVWKF